MREILGWAADRGSEITWGKGSVYGTFYLNLPVKDRFAPTFGILSDGQVEIGFQTIASEPSFEDDARRELLRAKLNEAGVDLPPEGIQRWPRIRLSALARPGVLSQFLEVWEWYRAEIERHLTQPTRDLA